MQIREAAVFSDIFGRKMAVVVDDRLLPGMLVVEPPGDFIREKEILMEKCSHAGQAAEYLAANARI